MSCNPLAAYNLHCAARITVRWIPSELNHLDRLSRIASRTTEQHTLDCATSSQDSHGEPVQCRPQSFLGAVQRRMPT